MSVHLQVLVADALMKEILELLVVKLQILVFRLLDGWQVVVVLFKIGDEVGVFSG